MSLRRVTSKDFPLIVSWYKARQKHIPDPRALSDTVFIADNRVAAWLFLTNSNMAIIEGVISDPASIPSLRRESLNKLIGFMVDFAVELGYTQIIGITRHPQIEKLGKKYGFKQLQSHKVLYLNASDDKDEGPKND
jgi:hypothetical protein